MHAPVSNACCIAVHLTSFDHTDNRIIVGICECRSTCKDRLLNSTQSMCLGSVYKNNRNQAAHCTETKKGASKKFQRWGAIEDMRGLLFGREMINQA